MWEALFKICLLKALNRGSWLPARPCCITRDELLKKNPPAVAWQDNKDDLSSKTLLTLPRKEVRKPNKSFTDLSKKLRAPGPCYCWGSALFWVCHCSDVVLLGTAPGVLRGHQEDTWAKHVLARAWFSRVTEPSNCAIFLFMLHFFLLLLQNPV